MVDYTNPLVTTFELQRQSIEQSQQAIEQTVELPHRIGTAALDSLDSQEEVQRSVVELHQKSLHSFLDALEESFSGVEMPTEDIREMVDDQYGVVLENHEELFDALEEGVDESVTAYDDLSADSLEALDDLIQTLVEAHEELEEQSVDAAEQVSEQVEETQDQLKQQVEDVSEQIRDASEQAVESAEA